MGVPDLRSRRKTTFGLVSPVWPTPIQNSRIPFHLENFCDGNVFVFGRSWHKKNWPRVRGDKFLFQPLQQNGKSYSHRWHVSVGSSKLYTWSSPERPCPGSHFYDWYGLYTIPSHWSKSPYLTPMKVRFRYVSVGTSIVSLRLLVRGKWSQSKLSLIMIISGGNL